MRATTLVWSLLFIAVTSPLLANDLEELFDPISISANFCGARLDRTDSTFLRLRQAAVVSEIQSEQSSARKLSPGDVPLWGGLGTLTYKISATARAQAYFDQGLRLLYAFNHGEAIRSFRAAQALDPGCAMCFWGEAVAFGPNINLQMPPEAQDPALAAVAKARKLARRVQPRERALIAALGKRYSAVAGIQRSTLDVAYCDAMAAVHARYPRDADIAVLYAEAAMNTTPWDYWTLDFQRGGRRPKGRMGGAVRALEEVLRTQPNHPGAIHYYIHVMEAVAPEKAEPGADRLAALMPAAGHIVHMPSHIFFRLGRYTDALEANLAAVEADEALFEQAEPSPVYKLGYYPHNIHVALESASMAGDAQDALLLAEKLAANVPIETLIGRPFSQRLAVAPFFAHVLFSAPEITAALPRPTGPELPFPLAMWHYARGSAFALQKNVEKAEAEAAAIATIAATADLSPLENVRTPAAGILSIAEHVVRGRIAGAQGDWAKAVIQFEAAAALQDALPYMEPPYWYYPTRQSLGVALLRGGRPADATEVLRRALVETPNNGRVLFALRESAKASGDAAAAAAYDKLFRKAWRGHVAPDLNRL